MFATAVTLAVIGFSIKTLADLAKQDGAKVLAAFQGRSLPLDATPARPIIVRISSGRRAEAPAWQTKLSAAA